MPTSHRTTLTWIGLACVSVLVTLFLLIIPSIRRIRELNREMLQRKIALEEQFQQGQSTKKIANNLERVETLVPTLDSAFLYRGDELAFITTIEAAADGRHLNHTLDFTVDPSKQASTPNGFGTWEVPVTLQVSGSYQDVYHFLEDIDRLPFYITINSISLSGGDTRLFTQTFGSRSAPTQSAIAGVKNSVTADIQGVTYWREKDNNK